MKPSKTIEDLKALKEFFEEQSGGSYPVCLEHVISALEKQEQDRWIPVTERLPEEDEDVLVSVHFLGLKETHPNGWNDLKPFFYIDIASHYSGEWCGDSDEYKVARSRHIVTAWRPLPEPYTEEKS